jgi:FKBP-type peptidyl-prolyl cis-trans isomerase FkpA
MNAFIRSVLAVAMAPLILTIAGCGANDSLTGPSGGVTQLEIVDVKVGTGTSATNGRLLTVRYTGWFYNQNAVDHKGGVFDSGTLPFTLGAGSVIRGWDQGLVGLKVGGIRQLTIPPSLGYGSQAQGPIPANSTLIFEVELLNVQ